MNISRTPLSLIVLMCLPLIVAACGPSTSNKKVAHSSDWRSVSEYRKFSADQLDLDDLDKANLNQREYMSWLYAARSAGLTGRVSAACDPGWFHSRKFGSKSKVRTAERALKEFGPDRIACYLREGQNIAAERIIQIEYLNEATRDSSYVLCDTCVPIKCIPLYFSSELCGFKRVFEEQVLNQKAYWQNTLSRSEAYDRQVKAERRASNAAARGMAIGSFAKDNPFNRPNPGLTNINRTSTMVLDASPAERAAMDAVDRAPFGDNAYYATLARYVARAAPAPSAGAAGIGSGAISLKQSKYCAAPIPGNKCPSESLTCPRFQGHP